MQLLSSNQILIRESIVINLRQPVNPDLQIHGQVYHEYNPNNTGYCGWLPVQWDNEHWEEIVIQVQQYLLSN